MASASGKETNRSLARAAAASPDPAQPLSEPSSPASSATGDKAGIARSASRVSFGVMVSRVLGLVREQVLAYLFAARVELDAFYAAFRIPNMLRDMFGEGALSKAFVSTFSEIQEREGKEAALELASLVFNALFLSVGALTLLGIVYADSLVDWILPGSGFDTVLDPGMSFGFTSKRELTVWLTRLMFPFILLATIAALVMGLLNARGRFLVPALASSFFNIGSLVVGVSGYFLAPRFGYHPASGMAVGVLAGGALQLLWQLPSLFRLGFRYRPRFDFRDPRLKKVLTLFGPGALIASTVQVNLLVNSIFASVGEGWMTWLMQAFRLLHLPIGLVGVAVSVATLPALSRAVARKDDEFFREAFSQATRLVILFTLPATIGLIVLAEPIVRLIFQQGAFGPADTLSVAAALRFYAVGLSSFAAVKIVTDGFYALQDIRIPLLTSVGTVAVNAGLNWLFVLRLNMDHRGLALATSCTMTASLVVLGALFRRRAGFEGWGKETPRMVGKVLAVSLVMGGVAHLFAALLGESFPPVTVAARLAQVSVSILAALAIFYAGCRLLRVRELEQALSAILPKAS